MAMSIREVRHRLLYFKDIFQGTLYTALSNARWLSVLSPVLAFVVRPLQGLTLSTLALLQAWVFFHTSHKNIDGWMITVSSLGSALFNNIGAFGGFIARVLSTTFIFAPWFFVTGFAIGAISQLTLALINARRAYEASPGAERKHYLQSMFFNLIMATQLNSCVAAIVLFNLFPASTVLITVFALTVVAINVGSMIWRFQPSEEKRKIKKGFGVGKPEQQLDLNKNSHDYQLGQKHTRLFTTCNYTALIKTMNEEDSKNFLLKRINEKLNMLNKKQMRIDKTQNMLEKKQIWEDNRQKLAVVKLLEQVMHGSVSLHHPGNIHKRYPRLVSNLRCEKSDTQQLLESVWHYQQTHKNLHKENNHHYKEQPKPNGR